MVFSLTYLYLLTPLHTGGASQEGNLVGIARESHTTLPYIPSSTIRGRLRANTEPEKRNDLWGNTIEDVTGEGADNLTQGKLWVGDASILWFPVPSLSHGVVWVTSPLLLKRWARFHANAPTPPPAYSTNLSVESPIYLKDAILKPGSDADNLKAWENWDDFVPKHAETSGLDKVLVLPEQHCTTLIQMSLWRQVKIKLDVHKSVDGGFRYEEAIPPDTVMYLPWGVTAQAAQSDVAVGKAYAALEDLIQEHPVVQIGGQESLGRGFVQQWLSDATSEEEGN